MPDAVIVSACRTSIGTAFKGTLTETPAFDLAQAVVNEAMLRGGVAAHEVDDVLGGTVYGGGDIARHTAVAAGMMSAPGAAVNRHCASGLSALTYVDGSIRSGMDDAIIAGGVHSTSTSRTAFRRVGTQEWDEIWISPSHPDTPEAPNRDMSITVGWNAAVRAGVSREDMEAWALKSLWGAIQAIDEGRFADEIVPIKLTKRDGTTVTFEVDEHPRRETSMEKLASLKPLHPEIEGFGITAGNAAGINDAAAALLLTSETFAADRGLRPLATVRSWASVGVPPAETGLAPVQAIPKALRRAGIDIGDVDLFEINEAFASMCVATTRLLDIDPDIVNVSGSGCSLGHPIAATGARMVTTLVHELRRRGGGTGVAAMCAGGGMSTAVVLEVVAA